MSFETLALETDGGIARITLDQPKTFNALSKQLASDLREALGAVRDDASVRALVLTGTGKGFCAGGDVSGFHDAADNAPAHLRTMTWHLHAAIASLADLDVPVLAGINGATAGAGMGLCMAADLAVAKESAFFTMAYTAIGATPDGSSTFFLPRLIGTRRAMEMALLNRRLSAAEALDWGLINEVVPDTDFDARLDKLAKTLAAGPTRAFAGARKLIRDSAQSSLAAQLDAEQRTIVSAAHTRDFREGVAAFLDKRKPDFRGS